MRVNLKKSNQGLRSKANEDVEKYQINVKNVSNEKSDRKKSYEIARYRTQNVLKTVKRMLLNPITQVDFNNRKRVLPLQKHDTNLETLAINPILTESLGFCTQKFLYRRTIFRGSNQNKFYLMVGNYVLNEVNPKANLWLPSLQPMVKTGLLVLKINLCQNEERSIS